MKKVILFLGIALGTVLTAVIILSFVAPKKISITSKAVINAPTAQVYDQLRFMKNYTDWSYYKQLDPEQKTSVGGQDGQVGATFSWEGVKEEGKGTQQVIELLDQKKVKLQCNIITPFEAHPTFDYTLNEKNGSVEVIQQFDVEMPFPANVFGLVFGLKAEMASINQKGLASLKKHSEKLATLAVQ